MYSATPQLDMLDIFAKVATIVIASLNLLFAIYVFYLKNKKEEIDKNEKHNIELFKEIILKPNINFYFGFIDNIYRICNEFSASGISIKNKIDINSKLEDEFYSFRRKFISLIGSVDKNLQNKIQDQSDRMQSTISEIVFNDSIDLTIGLYFVANISNAISDYNQSIITDLFSYKGKY